MEKSEKLVCRCEEVTEGEIREAIRSGVRTIIGVKRATRAGMGLCQGRTCQRLVEQLIVEETGQKLDELQLPTKRPPIRAIKLGIIGRKEEKK